VSGGTVAGRGEPANRCWGARGYADATIMCERCKVANQQIVGASRGRSSSELIGLPMPRCDLGKAAGAFHNSDALNLAKRRLCDTVGISLGSATHC
jgi:hypothetical protein